MNSRTQNYSSLPSLFSYILNCEVFQFGEKKKKKRHLNTLVFNQSHRDYKPKEAILVEIPALVYEKGVFSLKNKTTPAFA